MERKLENKEQQIKLKQIGESKRKCWIKWSGRNKIRKIGKGRKRDVQDMSCLLCRECSPVTYNGVSSFNGAT
jgi:hypothetical protein